MEDTILDSHTSEYFGCSVTAFVTENTNENYPAFPWRFEINTPDGKNRKYWGMPNYVETKRKALKRGWWRAKWLAEDTYSKRYKKKGI
jgi:hypothetical protein